MYDFRKIVGIYQELPYNDNSIAETEATLRLAFEENRLEAIFLNEEEYFLCDFHVFDEKSLNEYLENGTIIKGLGLNSGEYLYIANVISTLKQPVTTKLFNDLISRITSEYKNIDFVCANVQSKGGRFTKRKVCRWEKSVS